MKNKLLIFFLALICASCRTTLMGPSTVLCSDKIEDLNGAKIGDELIRGTASEHFFIFSHFVLGEAAPQRAVESAIKHGGENCLGLSEATITARFVWWLPLVYTHYSYTAEGKPIYRRQE